MANRTDEQRAADNKRKQDERGRKKEAGLVRVDVHVHPSRLDELRVIEKRLHRPK